VAPILNGCPRRRTPTSQRSGRRIVSPRGEAERIGAPGLLPIASAWRSEAHRGAAPGPELPAPYDSTRRAAADLTEGSGLGVADLALGAAGLGLDGGFGDALGRPTAASGRTRRRRRGGARVLSRSTAARQRARTVVVEAVRGRRGERRSLALGDSSTSRSLRSIISTSEQTSDWTSAPRLRKRAVAVGEATAVASATRCPARQCGWRG